MRPARLVVVSGHRVRSARQVLLFYRETPVAKTAVTGHMMGLQGFAFAQIALGFHNILMLIPLTYWKEVGAEWLKPNPTTGKGTMVRNSFLLRSY